MLMVYQRRQLDILDEKFANVLYSVAKILRLSDDLEGAKVRNMSPKLEYLTSIWLNCSTD